MSDAKTSEHDPPARTMTIEALSAAITLRIKLLPAQSLAAVTEYSMCGWECDHAVEVVW